MPLEAVVLCQVLWKCVLQGHSRHQEAWLRGLQELAKHSGISSIIMGLAHKLLFCEV